MIKRKVSLLFVCILCVVCISAGAFAGGVIQKIQAEIRRDFVVEIDGAEKIFKNADGKIVYPVLYEGTTYLPLRVIGELMDKTVYWYEDEKRIVLKDKSSTTVTAADVIVESAAAAPSSYEADAPFEKDSIPVETPTPPAKPEVSATDYIGVEKAKEIALQKAGLTPSQVRFERVELDEDNGVWHYEVEFRRDFTEYDADVNAVNGNIIKWEVDIDD